MALEDTIDTLIQATNVVDRVANGAIDEVVVSGSGNLITMATANRDIQAAIDAIESASSAGLVDIATDVSTVDTAAALALVSIQDDVDTVGAAALDFAANIQPIGSIVKNVSGTPPNDNLKIDGTVLNKYDYTEYTDVAQEYRPDSVTAYSKKQTTVFPYNTRLQDICFANGKFVAVGYANGDSIGAISSDGINWEYRLMGIANYPLQIGYFDFDETPAILYAFGSSFAASSLDGLTWETQTNYPTSITTMVYSEFDEFFVVAGGSGYIGTSNGINSWVTRTPAASYSATFYGSAYGNGIFVLVGANGEIQTSDNGNAWTHRANANSYTDDFKSAAYNNGVFVCVGEGGQIQRSADNGTTWTAASTSNGYAGEFRKIQAVPQGFLAIGNPVSGEPIEVHASTDGTKWNKIDVNNPQATGVFVTNARAAVNKNNNEVVIAESHGGSGTFFYKTPGFFQKPAKRTDDISGAIVEGGTEFFSIAYSGSIYVVVGEQGTIYSSPNRTSWTQRTADNSYTDNFRKVIYDDGVFVAVGETGEIQHSLDGILWVHVSNGSSSTRTFYDVCFANGVFVIPDGPDVQTSTDGIVWTRTVVASGESLTSVEYGNGVFLLAGSSIYISANGASWVLKSRKETIGYAKIAFGNNYFLLTDLSNSIYKTVDGTDPKLIYTQNSKADQWYDFVYAEGVFILIGHANMADESRTFSISVDGEEWEDMWDDSITSKTSSLYSTALLGGAYLDNKLWITGAGSVRSTNILTYNGLNLYRPDSTTLRTNTISQKLAGVCFGNDLFVAVGGDVSSEVHSSPDGITWTSRSVGGNYFNDIIFHDGYFVVVGSNGIYRSYDDLTAWASCSFASAPPSQDIKGITKAAYTAGMGGTSRVGYILVGATGLIATNNNGYDITSGWTPRTPDATYTGTFYAAAYGKRTCIVVGSSGEIQTSEDGITWVHTANANSFAGIFYAATYSEGLFIIAGASGEIQVSIDGLIWNSVEPAEVVDFNNAFVYRGIYFLVGSGGSIQYSYNGYDWKLHESSTSVDLFGGVGNDGNAVIVGGTTGTAITLTTDIGLDSGTEISTPQEYFGDMLDYTDTSYTDAFQAAHASDNLIVLSGQTNKITTSPDGVTWTDRDRDGSYTGAYYCGAYGNGVHVIAGYDDLQVSIDGVTWSLETWGSGFSGGLHGMAFGNGLFVAGGDSAEIQTSPDGVTWTRRTAAGAFASFFTDVAYGNGIYVMVGYDGEIQTSPDGITWTHRANDGAYTDNFNAIAFKNGIFLAVGENGELQRSTDNGATWESITLVPAYGETIVGIGTTKTMFVLVSYMGEIRVSTDGTIWQKIYQQGYSGVYYASAALDDVLVIAGGTGEINAADIHTIGSFDHNYQVAVPLSKQEDNFVNYTRVL